VENFSSLEFFTEMPVVTMTIGYISIRRPWAGLPDIVCAYQKYQSGNILEGLDMENVDLFYGHLECV
jgi:hypothetical protein